MSERWGYLLKWSFISLLLQHTRYCKGTIKPCLLKRSKRLNCWTWESKWLLSTLIKLKMWGSHSYHNALWDKKIIGEHFVSKCWHKILNMTDMEVKLRLSYSFLIHVLSYVFVIFQYIIFKYMNHGSNQLTVIALNGKRLW